MTYESIISILGTTVTLIGTFITVYQAIKVRKYSEEIRVDRLKNSLMKNIMVSETIRRESSKLRTSVDKRFARGFDAEYTLNTIEDYLYDIKELAVRFELDDIAKTHQEIEKLIGNYKGAGTETRYVIGDEIDKKVNDLIIGMKQLVFD